MIKPNNDKLRLSRGLNDMRGGFITSDTCHNYGIMSGCDEGCPVLLAGDCENFNDAIECCAIETQEEIKLIYVDS